VDLIEMTKASPAQPAVSSPFFCHVTAEISLLIFGLLVQSANVFNSN
jgi:hypothetical protein